MRTVADRYTRLGNGSRRFKVPFHYIVNLPIVGDIFKMIYLLLRLQWLHCFPFPSSKPTHAHPPTLISFSLSVVCVHVYVHMCIPKYVNIYSVYIILIVPVCFQGWLLGIGKTVSPALSIPWLPVVLSRVETSWALTLLLWLVCCPCSGHT